MRPKACCARRIDGQGRWLVCELRPLHQGDHVWWLGSENVALTAFHAYMNGEAS